MARLRIELTAAFTGPGADAGLTRLTRQGFSISGPRFDRDACAGCPPSIVYSARQSPWFSRALPRRRDRRRTGTAWRRDFSDPRRRSAATRSISTRSRSGATSASLQRSLRLVARRRARASADVGSAAAGSGSVARRQDARLRAEQAWPPGSRARAVPDALAQPEPQRRRRSPITTLIAEPDTQFDGPKWSPDGRSIAVERHRLDGAPEIVVVDVATKAVRVVAAAPHTRFTTPAWRPDGTRHRRGGRAPKSRRSTCSSSPSTARARGSSRTPPAARCGPTCRPTARRSCSSATRPTATTCSRCRIQTARPAYRSAPTLPSARRDLTVRPTTARSADRPYSPLDTLKPTSWTPVIETRRRSGRGSAPASAATTCSAITRMPRPRPGGCRVRAARRRPTPPSPDWQAYYLYDRWRPTLFLSAASDTSFFAGPATDAGTPTPATRRDRQFEGGVVFPIRHARVQHSARLSIGWSVADFTLASGLISRDRTPIRATWQTVTAHSYGYSISREAGIAGGATIEVVRRSLGSFADATTATADAARLPAGPGAASRDRPARGRRDVERRSDGRPHLPARRRLSRRRRHRSRQQRLLAAARLRAPTRSPAAASPSPTPSIAGRSRDRSAAAARGRCSSTRCTPRCSPMPVTRGRASFERRAIKTSAGAQLSADAVAGFFAPFTVTVGAAWGHDGSGLVRDGATALRPHRQSVLVL